MKLEYKGKEECVWTVKPLSYFTRFPLNGQAKFLCSEVLRVVQILLQINRLRLMISQTDYYIGWSNSSLMATVRCGSGKCGVSNLRMREIAATGRLTSLLRHRAAHVTNSHVRSRRSAANLLSSRIRRVPKVPQTSRIKSLPVLSHFILIRINSANVYYFVNSTTFKK